MNFDTISPNGSVDCYVMLKTVEKKTSAKGGAYLDVTISNKTGEMNAKLWDYSSAKCDVFPSGTIVKVKGTIDVWNNSPQLKIEKIREANNIFFIITILPLIQFHHGLHCLNFQLLQACHQQADKNYRNFLFHIRTSYVPRYNYTQ